MQCLIFLSIFLIGGISCQCVNEAGNPVDWFVMLKMPNGVNYLYADNTEPTLREGTRLLTQGTNPVARVLKPIYSGATGVNYIVYNDAPPDGSQTQAPRAHAKGAVVWRDGATRMQWLIHSVPKFPGPGYSYAYPDSAVKNGQSFLCVTMNLNIQDLTVITEYMYYAYPKIYAKRVAPPYVNNVPNLEGVLKEGREQKHEMQALWWGENIWTPVKNVKFYVFAKTGYLNVDFYKYTIAPYFKDGLYTQTWLNGEGTPLPSNCTGSYSVWNVKISEVQTQSGTYEFLASINHSKWAITKNEGYVCVGDLNRMESQKKRGGGMVCFKQVDLAKQIRAGITYDPCKSMAR